MNKVFILNNKNINKYVPSMEKNIPCLDIHVLNSEELYKYENDIPLKKESPLYNDYLRIYIAYKEGGLILDGEIEVK